MACLVDCWDLGPPPNSIKFLPPPPLPAFLQRAPLIESLLKHASNASVSPCATQLCDRWLLGALGPVSGDSIGAGRGAVLMPPGGEYVDLPRHDWGNTGSGPTEEAADTWLMVLIGCSVGVLLLGAVLALFLLRCREVFILSHRQHHQSKTSMPHHHHSGHIDHCSNPTSQIKVPGGAETVLYPTHNIQNGHHTTDNRLLWAALTPRGTQHFISESYPHDFMGDYSTAPEGDNTYETIENYLPHVPAVTPIAAPVIQFKTKELNLANEKASFDNSGFVDYDYEDPTPLIESYQLNDIDNYEYTPCGEVEIGNMHQVNTLGSLRRAAQIRPRVSSPTRIENPNLPPLNLHPHATGMVGIHRVGMQVGGTLRRGTLSRRGSDVSSFGK